MGHLIRDAKIVVGLVGLDDPTAKRITEIFSTGGIHDPGQFGVVRFSSLKDAKTSAAAKKIHAVCLELEKYSPDELTAFISEIRIIAPLVSFCLVGSTSFLRELPGFHNAWKDRLSHYYKVASDTNENDFDVNIGVIRDLFVADSVKTRGLGQYVTTPGVVIRLKSPRPYGFWMVIVASIIAAVVGGSVGPALDRLFPREVQPHTTQ